MARTIPPPPILTVILLLLLLLAILHPSLARQEVSQPHIVLIVADDLGYNDVPWHNPTIISPHLQDLAKAGVILEQNYVQTKCAPSRAALMTGDLMLYLFILQHFSFVRPLPIPHWAAAREPAPTDADRTEHQVQTVTKKVAGNWVPDPCSGQVAPGVL